MNIDWLDLEKEKQFQDYPDLFHAVYEDDVEELRAALKSVPHWGGSPLDQTRPAFDEMTPIHLACVRGSRKVFDEMMSYGKPFDPFIEDGLGRMAIDYALAFRRDDMARALQARMYPAGWAAAPKKKVAPAGP